MQNIDNNKLLREENAIIHKNLNLALYDLNKAKTKIKQERWNSKGMKLLWGAGGLLLGVLVGGTLIAIGN